MAKIFSLAAAPVAPFIQTLRHYSPRQCRQDVVAGLTVAVVAVPQAMAYALIAGVPPVYGLYSAIVQGLVAAPFTSSNYLSTGPINTLSLLVASAVARLSGDPAHYPQLVFVLTLMVGALQLAFASARMSGLVQYVSHSVIVGFTAGAGILIAAGQIPNFLGIASAKTRHLPGVLGIVERMMPHLHQVNWLAVGIGTGTLIVVLIARRISRFVPGPLIAAVGAATLVWATGWEKNLSVIGVLPRSLPKFSPPPVDWATAEALLGGAMALSLVGMLEAFSIAKSLAARAGERINPNQEFLSQGVANFVSSFFQCVPGSGSFSRSALNYHAGAATSVSGVFNSIFIAVIFLLFAPAARYIPLTALAAILFVIAYGLIDWRYIVRVLPSSRADGVVCLATLAATLLIPLEFAILVGIFLNIGLYLRTASRLHLNEMVQVPGGRFLERPLSSRGGDQKIMFLQMEGDLFFGVADELENRLSQLLNSDLRVVIFRLKRTHSIDATVLNVLERFTREMRNRGSHVILCGVKIELMQLLRKYGLVDQIGRENVFETGFGVFASAKRALARAKQLVGSSIDAEGLDFEDEPTEFFYQI